MALQTTDERPGYSHSQTDTTLTDLITSSESNTTDVSQSRLGHGVRHHSIRLRNVLFISIGIAVLISLNLVGLVIWVFVPALSSGANPETHGGIESETMEVNSPG